MPSDTVTDRLISSIKATGLTLKGFSDSSGIPYPSLKEYASGKRKPGMDALTSILKLSGVSADWLFLGKGDMYRGPTEEEIDPDLLMSVGLDLELAVSQSHLEPFCLGLLLHFSARIYNKVKGLIRDENRSQAVLDEARYLVKILESRDSVLLLQEFPQAVVPAKDNRVAELNERHEQAGDVEVTKGDD